MELFDLEILKFFYGQGSWVVAKSDVAINACSMQSIFIKKKMYKNLSQQNILIFFVLLHKHLSIPIKNIHHACVLVKKKVNLISFLMRLIVRPPTPIFQIH